MPETDDIQPKVAKLTIRRHPDISDLSLEKQDKLFHREQVIKRLIDYRLKYHRLPRKTRRDAAKELGLGWRMVDQSIKDYLAYKEAYPDDPPVNVFVPLPPGPEQGFRAKLTESQKRLIRYAILERSRLTVGAKGRRGGGNEAYEFEILDVYRFASAIDPNIGSYSTVQRYITKFRKDYPALFKLFTDRENFERDHIVKITNNAQRPNQRWQSDIRDLPFYVLHDGMPCPVSLIIIIDDYSRYIVGWKLIIKVKRDIGGRLKRVNPTAKDIAELLAETMYLLGVRSEEWYTDNGSQYIALDDLVARLADTPPIVVLHSRPRMPWGRGKVENGLGQVTRLLRRLQDGYRRRRSRDDIERARRSARYTIEELEAEFGRYFKEVNTAIKGKAPSRYQLWTSKASLSHPNLWRLAHLGIENKKFELPLTEDGVRFLGTMWEPKLSMTAERNRRILKRWSDAVDSEQDQVIWAVRIQGSWRAEVSVRGEWIEMVPKGSQTVSGEDRGKARSGSIRDINAEGMRLLAEAKEEVLLQAGGIPHMDTATGNYILPNNLPPEEKPLAHPPASKRRSQKNKQAALPEGTQRTAETGSADAPGQEAPPATPRRLSGMEEELQRLRGQEMGE